MPPADPSCKPPAELADHFKKAGYTGLAYGTLIDGRGFYILTAKDGKWAYITPDNITGETACTPHEGKGFQTARPTGKLMLVSAPAYGKSPTLQPVSYIQPGEAEGDAPLLDENHCGDTDKIERRLN